MKCSILHESAGRLRVRLHCPAMTLRQADILEYYLRAVDGVTEVKVYDRTRDAVVCFACGRGDVIASLAAFSFPRAEAMDLVPEHTSRALNREFEDKLTMTVARRIISRLFLPAPVTTALAVIRSVKYIRDTYDLVEYPDAYELINTYSTVMYVTQDDSGMSYVLDALGMMTQWSQINQPADCPAVAHPGQEQLLQIRDNLTKQDPVLAAIAPSQADPDRPVASSGDLYRLTDLEDYFARLSAG